MARSSTRKRIQFAFQGILNNLKWIRTHSQNIADLAGEEHPEIIGWAKGFWELAGSLAETVEKIRKGI